MSLRAALLASLALAGFLLAPPPAGATVSTQSVEMPFPKVIKPAERLRGVEMKSTLRIDLEPLGEAPIALAKKTNTGPGAKALQIGIGRDVPDVPEASSDALQWFAVDGGLAARWRVSSPGARALRIGLVATGLSAGQEIRFAGDGAAVVYGPFGPAEVGAMGPVFWSPVLEGESAIVELFVAASTPVATTTVSITQVSHLFASPTDANLENFLKDGSQACERDLICLSATEPALASVGKAVARMTFIKSGASYLCSGTLLTSTAGGYNPYFYSAYHCISNQAVANTLTTHWFYDRTNCGAGTTGGTYTQLPGGAQILRLDASTDMLFVMLNAMPPAGAVFAGWSNAPLTVGQALTGVHHPAGDWKKVSLATMGGYAVPANDPNFGGGPSGSFARTNWNSIATGVTEGGSSGSGIFSFANPGGYQLRGGLWGGPSSCSQTPDRLYDYYSRFDLAYPSLATYLNPLLADIAVTQSSPSTGSIGKDLVFTVTVTNNGPAAADVSLVDNLPVGSNFIWASPGCTHSGFYVNCAWANIPAGGTRVVRVVVRPTAQITITNQATAYPTIGDHIVTNNGTIHPVPIALTPAGAPINRYRLYSPVTLEHHFTTDLNEYNVLGTFVGTWVKEGLVGKVLNNPGTFNGVTAVPYYRLYDLNTAWHHWTTDANEYYTLGLFPGWNQEGVDGWILPTPATGTTQLFRLLYPHVAGLHHWTIDPVEYNALINTFGWVGEGGSGYVVQ